MTDYEKVLTESCPDQEEMYQLLQQEHYQWYQLLDDDEEAIEEFNREH